MVMLYVKSSLGHGQFVNSGFEEKAADMRRKLGGKP